MAGILLLDHKRAWERAANLDIDPNPDTPSVCGRAQVVCCVVDLFCISSYREYHIPPFAQMIRLNPFCSSDSIWCGGQKCRAASIEAKGLFVHETL